MCRDCKSMYVRVWVHVWSGAAVPHLCVHWFKAIVWKCHKVEGWASVSVSPALFPWPEQQLQAQPSPGLTENQSTLNIKVVYFPLIIIWEQSTMNGRCSVETHCQGLDLLLFGSSHSIPETKQEWACDMHLCTLCSCLFISLCFKGARISAYLYGKHILLLG